MQAFEGIRVVDFTHVLAGPFSTYQLAVMGADVIKIEPPHTPDMMRPLGYNDGMGEQGRGTQFICQNGNKRSLCVDLNTDAGVEIVRKLVAKADVVVENYRAGVLDRRGLGYEEISALNPGVIYCSITGFGRTGPKKNHPAYDNVIQAFSGLMAATGSPSDHPVRVGPAVLDYGTGSQAAFSIASALFQRSQSGKGQRIDVAMTDAALMLMTTHVLDTQVLGKTPVPFGNRSPMRAAYSLYDTKDGQVMLGAFTVKQNQNVWRTLGHDEIADAIEGYNEKDFARATPEQSALLTEILVTKTAQEWEDQFNEAGVPAARVRRIDETIAHDQIASRNVLQDCDVIPENGQQLKTPVAAFGYEHDGPAIHSNAPSLGQHTVEVLSELGYDDTEIAVLSDAGAIAVQQS